MHPQGKTFQNVTKKVYTQPELSYVLDQFLSGESASKSHGGNDDSKDEAKPISEH